VSGSKHSPDKNSLADRLLLFVAVVLEPEELTEWGFDLGCGEMSSRDIVDLFCLITGEDEEAVVLAGEHLERQGYIGAVDDG